jgi:hypothetical protein
MQAEARQRKTEIDLAALYRRRDAVLNLIRSLERYSRANAPQIQGPSEAAVAAA